MKAVILGWKRDYLKKSLKDCELISRELAKYGYDIYSGGGDGFMKSANKGAFEYNKKKSFGISVKSIINKENQSNNFYLKKNLFIANNFAERKKKLYQNADLIIFFQGGMGTLDELTEILNLMKTGEYKKNTPIILYGYKYWNSFLSWFEFNNIKFPFHLISGIIDSVEDFIKLHNNLNNKNNSISDLIYNIKIIKKEKKKEEEKNDILSEESLIISEDCIGELDPINYDSDSDN